MVVILWRCCRSWRCAAQAVRFAPPQGLAGSWVVDLSTSPIEPCTRPMVLTAGTLMAHGERIIRAIEAGRWRTGSRPHMRQRFRNNRWRGAVSRRRVLSAITSKARRGQSTGTLFNWNAARGD